MVLFKDYHLNHKDSEWIADFIASGSNVLAISIMAVIDFRPVFSEMP